MYHDIINDCDKSSGFQNESAFQYKVQENVFEEHLRALEKKDVVFTFDDGGVSFYTKAAPLLEKYGRRGVFFIATDYIGTAGFLSIEQILDLHKRGHIIGSHSCSHPENMSSLKNENIQNEWTESAAVLMRIIGRAVTTASIPNGYSSTEIIRAAQSAGYKELYTSEPTTKTILSGSMCLIGRYVVHDNMSAADVLRIIDSKGYRRKLEVRWRLLTVLKAILGNKYNKVKSLLVKDNK